MTVREAYRAILIELNKVKSPHIHLEDFIYFINKGTQEYINSRYNLFAGTQQLTDDLANLSVSATCTISPTGGIYTGGFSGSKSVTSGLKYGHRSITVELPDDYFHILTCIVNIRANFPYKCTPAGFVHSTTAKKLTSNQAGGVLSNAFLRPDINRPYHQIHDSSTNNVISDITILYGKSYPGQFTVESFSLDYLKKPLVINLTEPVLNAIVDTSTILPFSEYVCNEIVKKTVTLILENSGDGRLSTQLPINESIPGG